MKEEWRDIGGYEGKYQVSNLGNIKNNKNKILKPYKVGKGYLRVGLCNKGIAEARYIHRLVLETFKPRDDMNLEADGRKILFADHINNIKTDNRVENLQWLTCRQNVRKESDRKRFKKLLYKALDEV